jgi:UDP-N-acetylmuramoylalanine--D-glutamate ligase
MEAMLMNKIESSLSGAKVLVVGLGESGYSTVCYLASMGCEVRVIDSRDLPPRLTALRQTHPQAEVQTGSFGSHWFTEADLLVVSPGISIEIPEIQQARSTGVEVVGDVELFARVAQAPILGITGSNGKSTVTAMVGEMATDAGLDVAVGGNIGVPVLDLLRHPEPDLYVLELSSFQLETTNSLETRASALLNISQDHMDRYPDLAAYGRAKMRIMDGAGFQVFCRDDNQIQRLFAGDNLFDRSHCLSFGSSEPDGEREYGFRTIDQETWIFRGSEPVVETSGIKLNGRHNLLNVMAAIALAEVSGISRQSIIAGAQRFKGLPHRCELVGSWNDIEWVNDSKATNVGATVASLEGMEAPVILIAGGKGKEADFSLLRQPIIEKAKAVVVIGEDGPLIGTLVADEIPVVEASSMDEAVALAGQWAQAGDRVLLAPACASFDQFRDFQARGNAFTRAVLRFNK